MPTEEDERLFELEAQLSGIADTEENQAQRVELIEQIVALMVEIDAASP